MRRTRLIRRALPTAAIVLAAIAALAVQVTLPRMERLARLRTRCETLLSQAAQRDHAAPGEVRPIAFDQSEIEPFITQMQRLNGSLADATSVYDALVAVVRGSGLEIDSITPGAADRVGSRLETFGWNLVATGSFTEVVTLLDALHDLPGVQRVAAMRLATAAGREDAEADLTLTLSVEFIRVTIPAALTGAPMVETRSEVRP